jgi:hypothetical protein
MKRMLAMMIVLAAMTFGTSALLACDGCGCDKAKDAKSDCACDHMKGDMKGMTGGKTCANHAAEAAKAPAAAPAKEAAKPAAVKEEANIGKWVCPMGEEFVSDKPGKCPKCGMALVKKEKKK